MSFIVRPFGCCEPVNYEDECVWMHSRNHLISSGSTPGVIPWPKLAIQPHLLDLKPSLILLTATSIASRPPYKTVGSMFPCNATLSPTILRASTGSIHQSIPSTSYPPSSASSLSDEFAPFAKTIMGTEAVPSSSRRRFTEIEIYRRPGKENSAKS